ncbi:PDZ and LIM domain protein 5-like, partial [Protobothrops mucrosquamatus]|uniref:PDZ and LIM domain protein 5-like n=1 Tax=Protobothrops mucrosquamatus TaxID=103944 RepID=UPI0007758193
MANPVFLKLGNFKMCELQLLVNDWGIREITTVTKKNPPKRPPRKHVVYRNTDFFHPPVHSNNSKKRLIEDTEDWHPRTGTTQSRSFRILQQITGTERMKEPESDNLKKT